jgi:hypothetical protein
MTWHTHERGERPASDDRPLLLHDGQTASPSPRTAWTFWTSGLATVKVPSASGLLSWLRGRSRSLPSDPDDAPRRNGAPT